MLSILGHRVVEEKSSTAIYTCSFICIYIYSYGCAASLISKNHFSNLYTVFKTIPKMFNRVIKESLQCISCVTPFGPIDVLNCPCVVSSVIFNRLYRLIAHAPPEL